MRFLLLRSRSFWFGVPGLVFLLWAWVDSTRHATTLWFNGKEGIQVFQMSGTAQLHFWRRTRFTGIPGFGMNRTEIPDYQTAARAHFVAGFDLGRMIGDAKSRSAFFRHRTLVLGYLAPWFALVAWRWRRFRRAHSDMRAT